MPTIFWWPGKVPAGTISDELATTLDLLPTFARLAGTEPPNDRTLDGFDIRPLILGDPNATSPYQVFYYYNRDQLQAIRSGPWKLFLSVNESVRHPHHPHNQPYPTQTLLFNVVDDINCATNVADSHPDIVARLEALADVARQDLGDLNSPGSGQRPRGYVANPTPRVLEKIK